MGTGGLLDAEQRLNFNRYREALNNGLGALPSPLHRAVFACCCCERMEPNFRANCVLVGHENAHSLRSVLNQIWGSLEELRELPWKEDFRDISLEHLLPDESETCFAPLAEDAVGATEFLIRYCRGESGETDLVQVALWAKESATEWVNVWADYVAGFGALAASLDPLEKRYGFSAQPVEESDARDDRIESHPLVAGEMQQQFSDLRVLQSCQSLDNNFVRLMRNRSSRRGLQPFLRGLLTGHE